MTQEGHITLLWRHNTLANRDGHYEGCNGNQVASELLIQEQTQQQETLVHIISILSTTWYGLQVAETKQINQIILDKLSLPSC